MLLIVVLHRVGRRVINRALRDPERDALDLVREQRGFALGHLGLAVLGRDQLQQRALGRLLRNDGRLLAFAAGEELLEVAHHVTAFGFRRLVTTEALGLKDRADFVVKTHLLRSDTGGADGKGDKRNERDASSQRLHGLFRAFSSRAGGGRQWNFHAGKGGISNDE